MRAWSRTSKHNLFSKFPSLLSGHGPFFFRRLIRGPRPRVSERHMLRHISFILCMYTSPHRTVLSFLQRTRQVVLILLVLQLRASLHSRTLCKVLAPPSEVGAELSFLPALGGRQGSIFTPRDVCWMLTQALNTTSAMMLEHIIEHTMTFAGVTRAKKTVR